MHRRIARDFRDDGGTSAWRANQATVEVYRARGLRSWWRRTSPIMMFVQIVGGFAVFCVTLFLLGVIVVAVLAF